MVKQHINAKYQIEFPEGSRLMETLGRNNLLLACTDSEDPEFIIPHSYTFINIQYNPISLLLRYFFYIKWLMIKIQIQIL